MIDSSWKEFSVCFTILRPEPYMGEWLNFPSALRRAQHPSNTVVLNRLHKLLCNWFQSQPGYFNFIGTTVPLGQHRYTPTQTNFKRCEQFENCQKKITTTNSIDRYDERDNVNNKQQMFCIPIDPKFHFCFHSDHDKPTKATESIKLDTNFKHLWNLSKQKYKS